MNASEARTHALRLRHLAAGPREFSAAARQAIARIEPLLAELIELDDDVDRLEALGLGDSDLVAGRRQRLCKIGAELQQLSATVGAEVNRAELQAAGIEPGWPGDEDDRDEDDDDPNEGG